MTDFFGLFACSFTNIVCSSSPVQASIAANTWVVSGAPQTKSIVSLPLNFNEFNILCYSDKGMKRFNFLGLAPD